MENQLQSISRIFNEKIFRIPDYQRGYAWTEKQLKDYWSDIELLENNKNHYVGVLTLEKVPTEIYEKWDEDRWIIESKNYEPYYIVDGQQRLTTTIILIQSITELLEGEETLNYTTSPEIKKKFIFESKDNGISRSYIFGYEKDNPSYEYLKTNIFGEISTSGYPNEITIYTSNLEKAKSFFMSKLSELKKSEVESIYKKVTQNLLFNIYSITSDIDVFIAFETMNNRGKPLSNLELLKNRLIYLSTKFKTVEHEKYQLRKIINDGWRGIYHFLGLNKENPLNDDNFLNSHCSIYFGDDISEGDEIDIYRFRRNLKFEDFLLDKKFTLKNVILENKMDINSIKAYVESLQHSAKIWFYIFNPSLSNDFSDKEKLLLDRLSRLNLKFIQPLLLSIYLKKPKESIKINILNKLEKLIFIYSLTNYRMYFGIGYEFYPLAIDLQRDKCSLNYVLNDINTRIENILTKGDFIDRVIDNFKGTGGFYNWSGIRYFLYEYEQSIKDKTKNRSNKIEWTEYRNEKEDYITVEHIFPQSPKAECWKKTFNSHGSKEKRMLANSLGNLLPLSKPKNSSLQNKCFFDKIENGDNYVGFRYGSYSEIEVSKCTDWTPSEIKMRGIRLLKFMEQRWDISLGDDLTKVSILNLDFLK